MDIEGAEQMALKDAQQIIIDQKPKLAISFTQRFVGNPYINKNNIARISYCDSASYITYR